MLTSLYRYNFAVTSRGSYYMAAPDDDGTTRLRFYSFHDGSNSIIAPMGRPEFGHDVSPDGRYLIYAQLEDPASVLMLVENFH